MTTSSARTASTASTASTARTAPTLAQATRVWAGIGLRSFGGPTAQIALMHRELVQERGWLDEREFLDALGFCMLLPGPEAMQLATYAGWRLHGVRGGLVAGLLFVLPGACVVLALTLVYATLGQVPLVLAAFHGVRAAVLAIVVEALLRLSHRALTGRWPLAVAVAAFVALFAFAAPFPVVVLGALLLGWLLPPSLNGRAARVEPISGGASRAQSALAPGHRDAPAPRAVDSLRTALLWAAVWLVPLGALAVSLGPGHILTQLSWLFSKLAMVTFGGAYAVLAWLGQDVVARHGWLTPQQMLDGLGLAETTPGPLILVTEFVGFVAAHGAHPASSLVAGLAGAGVALWATFTPCFLWIFTGAPWVAAISRAPRLQSGLAVLTAAVLGVIANLSAWFALHVLFRRVTTVTADPLRLSVPELASLDEAALTVALVSGVLLLRFKWSLHRVLALAAVLGMLTLLVR